MKKRSRWDCPAPVSGRGYTFRWLRFPRCLASQPSFWFGTLHALWHLGVLKGTWGPTMVLMMRGFLYADNAGGATLTWQWRFWRGSPAQRQIREARLIT